MGVELTQVRVRDLVAAGALAINDGYRMRNEELGRVGTPFVRGGDIRNGSIDHQTEDHIRPEFAARIATKTTRPWDVAFITKGTVGRVGMVRPEQPRVVFAPQVAYWRSLDHDRLHPRFIYYLLSGAEFQARLDADKTHGAMVADYVSLSQQLDFRLAIPGIREQRAIAQILGAIDDKIELNRRTNETLEAMARALFKSWFVDFDPVRAKAEGRTPSGMDAATADLFPSELVDSELGPIPKGWRHVPVRDVCAGLFDGPHATPPESDGGAIFLGIKNFTPTSLDLTDVRYISERDYPRWTKRVVPAAGDIVFTYEATLGFFALIPPGIRCCLGRRTALIRPRSDSRDSHFLLEWFVAPPFQEFLRAHRQPGSTVDRIWLKDFPGYPVLRPPDDLVTRFDATIAPIWGRIHAAQEETAALRKTRDELLPRLLSGELSALGADADAGQAQGLPLQDTSTTDVRAPLVGAPTKPRQQT